MRSWGWTNLALLFLVNFGFWALILKGSKGPFDSMFLGFCSYPNALRSLFGWCGVGHSTADVPPLTVTKFMVFLLRHSKHQLPKRSCKERSRSCLFSTLRRSELIEELFIEKPLAKISFDADTLPRCAALAACVYSFGWCFSCAFMRLFQTLLGKTIPVIKYFGKGSKWPTCHEVFSWIVEAVVVWSQDCQRGNDVGEPSFWTREISRNNL